MTFASHEMTRADHRSARVVLAFDFDGPTGGAMTNGTLWSKPGYFGLGGYGAHRAMPRILDMLRAHGTAATFFTPAWVVETWPDLARRIVDEGHEMAGHGDRHEMFYGLPAHEQASILQRSQAIFHRVLGVTAAGFRAPSGDLAPETLGLLADHGYTYSSSMRSGDHPYWHADVPIIEIPAKSLFDDYSVFAYHRSPNFPTGLDRVAPYAASFATWKHEIEASRADGATVSTIWHPKVIASPGRAVLLDEFIGWAATHPGLTVMRADEVARKFAEEVPA